MAAQATVSGGLAQRYAGALFELADEAKELTSVASDLESFSKMIEESPELQRLIRSPVLSRDDQGRAMNALLEACKVGDLTRKFIGLLARNRRLFALPEMIRAFRDMMAGRRGETAAEVVTATKLSESQLTAIGESLKSAVGTSVSLAERIDPSLLGGMIVKVGSRMVDSSLRTKLQRLRLAMKGIG